MITRMTALQNDVNTLQWAKFSRYDTMTVFVEWATQFCEYNMALQPTEQMVIDAFRRYVKAYLASSEQCRNTLYGLTDTVGPRLAQSSLTCTVYTRLCHKVSALTGLSFERRLLKNSRSQWQ